MNIFDYNGYNLKIFRNRRVFNNNLWKSFFGIPVYFNDL